MMSFILAVNQIHRKPRIRYSESLVTASSLEIVSHLRYAFVPHKSVLEVLMSQFPGVPNR